MFFCLVFIMPFCASNYLCLVVTCWERADLLALVCGVLLRVCHFPNDILGQVLYLNVSILIFSPLLTFKRTDMPYFIITLEIKSQADVFPFFKLLTAFKITCSDIYEV